MIIHELIRTGLFAIALGAAAVTLEAQSMSTLTNAKRVASNAAAATNEHIRAEQTVGDAALVPPATASVRRATARPAASRGATAGKASATRTAAPGKDAGATRAPASSASPAPTRVVKPDGEREEAGRSEVTLLRESFTYQAEGRRDPFISLIESGELRPMISDLRLVTVIYAPAGRSVAVMRDVSTQEQYRVKSGQALGRMRVARIGPKSVTFTIEEYGFSRQEVLALNDSTRARSQ